MTSSNGHTQHLRDVAHERAFTAAAGALIGRSPIGITKLAEARAPLDPIRDFPFRDFALDALEELADCRNYIVWDALRHDLTRTGPSSHQSRAALQRALAHVIEAFAEVDLARRLTRLETSRAEA